MENKIKVIFTEKDVRYNQWEKGEIGIVDGYIRGGNDEPLAVIIKYKDYTFVLAPLNVLQAKI